MQYKITKMLNKAMIIISILWVSLVFLYVTFRIMKWDFKDEYLFIAVSVMIASMLIYWFLDNRLDKIYIEKMIKNKKIAIANIIQTRNLKKIADSTFRSYQLVEMEIEVFTLDDCKKRITYVEKFDVAQNNIPKGTVFITYDKDSPEEISLVPNLLISTHEELKYIVDNYEKKPCINIKYLYVEYRKGFLISTMKDYYYKSIKERNRSS